jgi:hypothetical protein
VPLWAVLGSSLQENIIVNGIGRTLNDVKLAGASCKLMMKRETESSVALNLIAYANESKEIIHSVKHSSKCSVVSLMYCDGC